MHETALALAARPERVAVLGLLLQPYSLGHELLLIRTGNTLSTPQDLAAAVLICCQGWRENSRIGRDWLLPLKLWIWKRRTRRMVFTDELARFKAYREQGSLELPLSEIHDPSDRPGRPLGTPLLLLVFQFLVIAYRLTEEQAWDYPCGLAKMLWQGHWEQEGGLKVKNYAECAHDRYVAEQEAKACQV